MIHHPRTCQRELSEDLTMDFTSTHDKDLANGLATGTNSPNPVKCFSLSMYLLWLALTLLSRYQQLQLGTFWKSRVLGSTPNLPETPGWNLAISFLTSPPGGSEVCSRLEISALESRTIPSHCNCGIQSPARPHPRPGKWELPRVWTKHRTIL